MRYVVDPKQTCKASSLIYREVFRRIRERKDIDIASKPKT